MLTFHGPSDNLALAAKVRATPAETYDFNFGGSKRSSVWSICRRLAFLDRADIHFGSPFLKAFRHDYHDHFRPHQRHHSR
jgi:hypothetical protein